MRLISSFLKPLSEMDTNVRKRKVDDSADGKISTIDKPLPVDESAIEDADDAADEDQPTPSKRARTSSSSSLSSLSSISDIGSHIDSPSPSTTPLRDSKGADDVTPIKLSLGSGSISTSNTKIKRTRLTDAEKQARADEKEKQRQEREQKKKLAKDKLAAEAAEKSQKKKEREEKKAIAEAEKHLRDKEREAKRAKKEEEERKAKQEKEKKERSQLRLNSFFKVPTSTPKAATKPTEEAKPSTMPATVPDSPAPNHTPTHATFYNKMFNPFFVKAGMRLAVSPFEMDEETRLAKSNILDEYISGRRGELEVKRLDPVEAFALVSQPKPRGLLHEPVKKTIERLRLRTQKAESIGDIQGQDQARRDARKQLARVSMKSIRFQQDVRPPYLGTMTQVPHEVGLARMRKVARKPTMPILPLNYDYDSEAEWQDEEGEDIDGDDEDEEDLEDGDEVGELIDDSEAVDLMRFGATGLEPLSTGICWEDQKRDAHCVVAQHHRLEFIFTEGLRQTQSIDPFSTAYWEPEPAIKPKPSATNAFEQISATAQKAAPATDADKGKTKKPASHAGLPAGLSEEDLIKIKRTIQSTYEATPAISKLGMLELLKSSGLKGVKINGKDISRNDVKTVIDVVALRKKKANEVTWSLKPEHEL